MNVVISMMITCFRVGLVVGYLGLKVNKSLSKFDLTYKIKENKMV